MIELWHRLCKRGYTRCLESLFRLMRKLEMFWQAMPSKVIQTQVLRADAISRLARLGRCESGAPEMPGQPQRAPVPVHGNRRIHSIALFMRLPGAKHVFFCWLSGKDGRMVQMPQCDGRMCTNGQWFWICQPFFQQQMRFAYTLRVNGRPTWHPAQTDPSLYEMERSRR